MYLFEEYYSWHYTYRRHSFQHLLPLLLLLNFPSGSTTVAVTDPWPCPGECWSNPEEGDIQNYQELWDSNCLYCTGIYNCEYGQYNLNNACYDCKSSLPSESHKTVVPTYATNCDLASTYVCDKGYRTNPLDPSGSCIPCVDGVVDCGKGFYPKRCVSVENSVEIYDLCNPCDNPPLPDQIKYRYGYGRLYDDCIDYKKIIPIPTDICAWFLTPKWERGVCDIECNQGYFMSASGGTSCLPCQTTCSPGWYPPDCPGGSGRKTDGSCLPCPNTLPTNAFWVSGCVWQCLPNTFRDPSKQQCISCFRTDLAISCSNTMIGYPANSYESLYPITNMYMILGCKDDSPGKCVACNITCPSQNFIASEPYMDSCKCSPCTQPQPGSTYIVQNCTRVSDTILADCSTCTIGKTFRKQACSTWQDTICHPCTPPVDGMLLKSFCDLTQDAIYIPCPSEKACDGSSSTFYCSSDKQAVNGKCVCKPGTQNNNGIETCKPMLCPHQWMYPDPISGQCQNCTLETESVQGVAVTGILGLAACGCPPGYFPTTQNPYIHCWPCGDLGCVAGIQRQSECSEFPTCQCAPGPGTRLQPQSGRVESCALQCAEGYVPISSSSLAPGLYDRFGFYANVRPQTAILISQSRPMMQEIMDIILVLPRLAVALCHDSSLYIIDMDTGQTAVFDNGILCFGYNRQYMGNVTAIAAHRQATTLLGSNNALFWVAFTYYGFCGDGAEETDCSTVELISLLFNSNQGFCMPEIQVCAKLASKLWGNTFPSIGSTLKISYLLLASSQPILYVGLCNFDENYATSIARYPIEFYSSGTPDSQRKNDYPLQIIIPPSLDVKIQAMAEALDSLYIIVANIHGIFKLTPTSSMYQIDSGQWLDMKGDGSNILWLKQSNGGWIQMDLWNSFQSTFAMQVTTLSFDKQSSTLVTVINSTSLVYYPSAMRCPTDSLVYHYDIEQSCESMQCIFKAPCGPFSFRTPGSDTCSCQLGYYFSLNNDCMPCPSSYFCPGTTTIPLPCPAHSFTTPGQLATQQSDCICLPGFYHLSSVQQCLPCPTNMWCPYNGTQAPVPCYAGGYTLVEGASSPLKCICPSRTFGLTCQPCDNSMDCVSIKTSTKNIIPYLTYSTVTGWGPVWGNELIGKCLSLLATPTPQNIAVIDNIFIIYPLSIEGSSIISDNVPDMLQWSWAFVVQNSIDNDFLRIQMTECLSIYGMQEQSFGSFQTTQGVDLRVAMSLGGPEWEWSGQESNPRTCIAGYEAVSTDTWGIKCFPCLNGTVRARLASGGCVPCQGVNEHAPYLGMSACVCIQGYQLSSTTGQCEYMMSGSIPWWYPELSNQAVVISLALFIGLMSIIASVLASMFY